MRSDVLGENGLIHDVREGTIFPRSPGRPSCRRASSRRTHAERTARPAHSCSRRRTSVCQASRSVQHLLRSRPLLPWLARGLQVGIAFGCTQHIPSSTLRGIRPVVRHDEPGIRPAGRPVARPANMSLEGSSPRKKVASKGRSDHLPRGGEASGGVLGPTASLSPKASVTRPGRDVSPEDGVLVEPILLLPPQAGDLGRALESFPATFTKPIALASSSPFSGTVPAPVPSPAPVTLMRTT